MDSNTEPKKRKVLKVKSDLNDRNLFAEFILLLNKGRSRDEMIVELDLSEDRFDLLFARYYEEAEQEQQAKTPLKIFVELVGRKRQLVSDLEILKEALVENRLKSPQAYVAAVKTQSDILDGLVKIGQNLGLIVKTPDQVLLVGGRDARDLDSEDLERSIENEMNDIRRIINDDPRSSGSVAEIVTFPAFGKPEKS
jgi:hypothetical protein